MQPNQEERAVKLAYFLWKSIDHEGMSASRRMGIWDEFQQKLIFAARAQTPEEMLETFAKKFGILTFRHTAILQFMDLEALATIRKSPRKIVLMLRNVIEIEKKEFKARAEKKEGDKVAKELLGKLNQEWDMFMNEQEGQNA